MKASGRGPGITDLGERWSACRAVLLVLLLWAVVGTLIGCTEQPPTTDAAAEVALKREYPEHATRVLNGSSTFTVTADGFSSITAADPVEAITQRGGLSITLPKRAEDPIRFRLLSGLEFQVREVGAAGEGRRVEGAVVYRTSGGTSFWTVTDDGYEEWLMLGPGLTATHPVAKWQVDGATLRELDGVVEIADADGLVQVRVTAPVAYTLTDRPVAARLAVHGRHIELWADSGGEAVLVDPVWSTATSSGVSRQQHTATLLTTGQVLVAGGVGSAYLSSAQLYTPSTNSWALTGPMSGPRAYHTAARLQDGKVLVAGGFSGTAALSSAEIYDPGTNAWAPTGGLALPRYDHAATILQSGRVLVVSGQNASGGVATAEQYNPSTGLWSGAGTLGTGRLRHSATLLNTGKVLVAGGSSAGAYLTSAQLYTPATNNWAPATSMTTGRQDHGATLLASGKVLIAGGYNGAPVSSVQIYDPVAGTWSTGTSLSSGRRNPTLTTLSNGRVLVAGGFGTSAALAVTELYDATANTWTPSGSLFTARHRHTATPLADGKVLIACGAGVAALASAELFDPVANSWTAAGALTGGRDRHTATLLPNGKVLVAGGGISGGGSTINTQLYDPVTNLWSPTQGMTADRRLHTATLLTNGNVLVAGGTGSSGYPTMTALYNPTTGQWSNNGVLSAGRASHAAVRLADGKVLVLGGVNGGGRIAGVEVFDPVALSWSPKDPLSTARSAHTATVLANGKVLVAGGFGTAALKTAELYDPGTNDWVPAGEMAAARYHHEAALLANGKVLVAGGYGSAGLATAELYDPDSNTWALTGTMAATRWGHAMTIASDGRVLVAGGYGAAGYTASAEFYQPISGTWSTTAAMTAPRLYHSATLLNDGSVLAACGSNSTGYLTGAEIYHPVPIDDGNPCTTDTWNVTLGQVTHTPVSNGTACNDGNACTQTDTCQAGACTGANPVVCTALNQCHQVGTCETTTGVCSNPTKPNGSSCNDGNGCTQTDTCQAGACTGSNPLICPVPGQCYQQPTCDSGTGTCPAASPKPNGSACTDANACTVGDSCSAGQCQSGSPAQIDDSNPCTTDACTASQGVTHTPVAAGTPCSDGDACDGFETCNAVGQCAAGTAWPNGTPCEGDGNACTLDACQSGVCTSTVQIGTSCTDNNPCTLADACNAAGQCQGTSGAAGCSDGDPCNGQETCSAGACVPGTPINSDDGNPNTLDVCHPDTGVVGHSDCSTLPDLTVATTTAVRATCLYTGSTPIQTGVPGQPFPGTLDPFSPAAPFRALKVSIVRGRVLDQAGQPLKGVHVSIQGKPAFGSTASRADGYYDLAVEGGGDLVVSLDRNGHLPAIRKVHVPWQRQVAVPDAVLVPVDEEANFVDVGETVDIQIARGTAVADARGARQATVLYLPGTEATVVTPDGNGGYTQTPLAGEVDFRITEYSSGPSGESAMPMSLPPASAFTYAVELGIDGVPPDSTVEFSGAGVVGYLENFLKFPTGETVPSGYLDRGAAQWVGAENGRVIKITSVALQGGIPEAVVDSVGATQNPALVLSVAERQKLATLYEQGQTLWRVPIAHFTPWDWNWGWGPPDGAFFPGEPDPTVQRPIDNPNIACGSTIECENKILGESLPVVGTPYVLHYQSDRHIGHANVLKIPLIAPGKTHPKLLKIRVEIQVAGKFDADDYSPTTTDVTFVWDGFDSYGELTQGGQPISVAIGYQYEGEYKQTGSFGSSGGDKFIAGEQATLKLYFWRYWSGTIGHYNAVHQQLGGWDLDAHHAYDPIGKALYLGDGRRRSGGVDIATGSGVHAGLVIDTFAGGSTINASCSFVSPQPALESKMNPKKLDFAPDGSAIIVDGCGPVLRRVVDGTMTTLTNYTTSTIDDVAVGADGTIYFTRGTQNQVMKIDAQGNEVVVAGLGVSCLYSPTQNCGDGLPATLAKFNYPMGLALASDGSLYISDMQNNRVRKISPNGIITTVAGGGGACNAFSVGCGDEGKATSGALGLPKGIDIGPDGTLYIADANSQRVRAVTPDGILHTVAGRGASGVLPAGCSPTSKAANCVDIGVSEGVNIEDVAIGPDGLLYIAAPPQQSNPPNNRGKVLRVQQPVHANSGPNGVLQRFAGGFTGPNCLTYECSPTPLNFDCAGEEVYTCGDGFIPNGAVISPVGIAFGPDGGLYSADITRVTVIGPSFPGLSLDTYVLPSEDASELYVFDKEGRHQETRDALTNKLLRTFTGTPFFAITEADGHTTEIARSASQVTISGPFDQTTTLGLTTAPFYPFFQYAATIENPANEIVQAVYLLGDNYDEGLLEYFIDAKGNSTHFEYDSFGWLFKELRPDTGSLQLDRADLVAPQVGHQITRTEKVKPGVFATTNYTVELLPSGGAKRTTTLPGGISTTTVLGADGSRTSTYPDGTTVAVLDGPDPRFSVLAPVPKQVTFSTGGKVMSVTSSRDVELANPNLVTSLVEQTETVNVNGRVFTTTFNAAITPRTVTHTSQMGRTTTITLDATDRASKVEVLNSLGLVPVEVTHYTSGPHKGRLHTVRQQSGTEVREFALTYDALGRLQQITGPEATATSLGYDNAGRVTSKTLLSGAVVGFDYDLNGNLEFVTPPGKPTHGLGHTPVNLLQSYTPPDGNAVTLGYTPHRRTDLVTRADAQTIDPVYDSYGRLDAVLLAGNTLDYQYVPFADANHPGKLDKISSSQDGIELSYGYSGSLLASTAWSGSIAGSVTHTYDNDLRVTTETVGGTAAIIYGYGDGDGLLTQAGDLSLILDPQTALLTDTAIGNVDESFSYNAFGEVDEHIVTFDNGSPTPVRSVTYERDGVGRLMKQTESVLGAPAVVTEYLYDPAGRLETVLENGLIAATYGYDSNGNRDAVDDSFGPAITCQYTTSDVLQSCGGTTYAHDAHGDLESKTVGGQTTSYAYDALGNLRTVTRPSAPAITYTVDGLGRRVGKRVGNSLVQGWLYDGMRVIAEVGADGTTVTKRFVYGSRAHVPDYVVQGSSKLRLVTDLRGSVRLVVDAVTGVVAQSRQYDAFGRIVSETGDPNVQPFGFAGGLNDSDTGLIRFGARDYDAVTGRWLTRDPILFLGGDTNLYAYCGGDPVNFIDPTGLASPQLTAWYALMQTYIDEFYSAAAHYTTQARCSDNVLDAVGNRILATATAVGGAFFEVNRAIQPVFLGGVLQTGGNTIKSQTARGLTDELGVNMNRRNWGRALEALKRAEGLPPNHHGQIHSNGNYVDPATGHVLGNLLDYIP